jgi:hypothetical protein
MGPGEGQRRKGQKETQREGAKKKKKKGSVKTYVDKS